MTQKPKLCKNSTGKENYRLISLIKMATKILNNIQANVIQPHTKGIMLQSGKIYPWNARWPSILKSMNTIRHINGVFSLIRRERGPPN
jgi:hypothetical protein